MNLIVYISCEFFQKQGKVIFISKGQITSGTCLSCFTFPILIAWYILGTPLRFEKQKQKKKIKEMRKEAKLEGLF